MSPVREITLTQGQVALVDDEDFEHLGKFKWCAKWDDSAGSFYAVRGFPGKNGVRCTTLYMHREILCLTSRSSRGDHKNHDTLDNRRENLRPATPHQNGANRKGAPSNSTTGVLGVTLDKRTGKWIARIKVNGKRIHVGYCNTKEEATAARLDANTRYYGEFGGSIK